MKQIDGGFRDDDADADAGADDDNDDGGGDDDDDDGDGDGDDDSDSDGDSDSDVCFTSSLRPSSQLLLQTEPKRAKLCPQGSSYRAREAVVPLA